MASNPGTGAGEPPAGEAAEHEVSVFDENEDDGDPGIDASRGLSLLPWQREAVASLLERDGVAVLGEGMGEHVLAAALLAIHLEAFRREPVRTNPMLVLGAPPSLRKAVLAALARLTRGWSRSGRDEADGGGGTEPGGGVEIEDEAKPTRGSGQAEGSEEPGPGGPGGPGPGGADGGLGGARGEATGASARAGSFSTEVPEITAEVPGAERSRLYASEGVVFVTARILVVDFLSQRLPPHRAAGLLLLRCHRAARDGSREAFAVRLFRGARPDGFVRAITDQARAFAPGFGGVERALRALRVRGLSLYPRFEAGVRASLEAEPPTAAAEELVLPLDTGGAEAATSLARLASGVARELRRAHPVLEAEGLDADSALLGGAEVRARRALRPVWSRVSPRARQLLEDLRTLRTLSLLLTRLDPVTYYEYLETLRATEGARSVWLFHSAAHVLFQAAKERVYKVSVAQSPGSGGGVGEGEDGVPKRARRGGAYGGAGGGAGGGGGGDTRRAPPPSGRPPEPRSADSGLLRDAPPAGRRRVEVTPCPVALPKWRALLELLSELEGAMGVPRERVVIVCRDAVSADQARRVVRAGGPERLLKQAWRGFLERRAAAAKVRGLGRAGDGGGAGARAGAPLPVSGMMGGSGPAEDAALRAAAAAAAEATEDAGGGGGGLGGATGGGGRPTDEGPSVSPPSGPDAAGSATWRDATDRGAGAAAPSDRPNLPSFLTLEDHDDDALWALQPDAAIVLEPDFGFTRLLELYAASRAWGLAVGEGAEAGAEPLRAGAQAGPGGLAPRPPAAAPPPSPLRIVLLSYGDSPETDAYAAAVRAERAAFERLIRGKATMTLPAGQALPGGDLDAAGRELAATAPAGAVAVRLVDNARTAMAGGRAGTGGARASLAGPTLALEAAPAAGSGGTVYSRGADGAVVARSAADAAREQVRAADAGRGSAGAALRRLAARGGTGARGRVVVDVREFNARLPGAVHANGLDVEPVTLEVGDYVLAPDVAVERKSLPDLRQSLANGRLVNQAKALTKHYETSLLLIEFDPDEGFSLGDGGAAAAAHGSRGLGPGAGGGLGVLPGGAVTGGGRRPGAPGGGGGGGGGDANAQLTAKLAQLALAFPRLQLLWSPSPKHSASLFRAIKEGRPEPDAVKAALVGMPLEADFGDGGGEGGEGVRVPPRGGAPTRGSPGPEAGDVEAAVGEGEGSRDAWGAAPARARPGLRVPAPPPESLVNFPALDVLRHLPGVGEGNLRSLAAGAGSLAGVAAASEAQLTEWMGGKAPARRLRAFLDQDAAAILRVLL